MPAYHVSCRYMLSRTAAVTAELQAAYDNYQFARFYQASLPLVQQRGSHAAQAAL